MSTRSYICKENEDGTYTGVYCHSDGYPEHNGAILIDHYNSRDKVEALIKLGNLSYLQPKIEPDSNMPHSFDFDARQEGVTVAYGRDRGETEQEAHIISLQDLNIDPWIEYIYIYTKDNKWKYFETGELDKGIKDLETGLAELFKLMGIRRPENTYGFYTDANIAEIKAEQENEAGLEK